MLYDLIQRIASDTGLDAVQQRNTITGLVNSAAKEFHVRLECNKIYKVVTLVVGTDYIISLPYYVGELRGVKNHCSELQINVINQQQPRFTKSTREYQVNQWTEMGESPLCQNLSTIGPLTLQTNSPSDNVNVLVNGETINAGIFEEVVLLNVASINTTNLFGLNITNIACFSPRTSDITVYDSNGNIVSVLYVSQARAKFKVIDVSKYQWGVNVNPDGSNASNLIDVLYKIPLSPMINDSDSFSAGDDYDDVLYHYAMYLYYLPQSAKAQDANTAKTQAFVSLKAVKVSEEEVVVKKLNFGRNKFYDLADKFRNYGSATNRSVADMWKTNYTY